MNKKIIYNFIEKMDKNVFLNILSDYDIILNNQEAIFLFNYLKNNYMNIIDNPLNNINIVKSNISQINYNKIINLYYKYSYVIDNIKKD